MPLAGFQLIQVVININILYFLQALLSRQNVTERTIGISQLLLAFISKENSSWLFLLSTHASDLMQSSKILVAPRFVPFFYNDVLQIRKADKKRLLYVRPTFTWPDMYNSHYNGIRKWVGYIRQQMNILSLKLMSWKQTK